MTNTENEKAKQSNYSFLMEILISEANRRIITYKKKDTYDSPIYSTCIKSQLKFANC